MVKIHGQEDLGKIQEPEVSNRKLGSSAASQKNRAELILGRIDRIPIWSLPASFLAVIGLGYFFTFFDITNIGFAMPAIASQFMLSGSETLFLAPFP